MKRRAYFIFHNPTFDSKEVGNSFVCLKSVYDLFCILHGIFSITLEYVVYGILKQTFNCDIKILQILSATTLAFATLPRTNLMPITNQHRSLKNHQGVEGIALCQGELALGLWSQMGQKGFCHSHC